jgi:serine/threonine protein kinase
MRCALSDLPDHQGNLHSVVQPPQNSSLFTEQKTQSIFRQIVQLVELCHRCGLYFRDFRLRKFVFVDKETNRIRLNSVLELHIAPDTEDDTTYSRQVCPAYVPPEVLGVSSTSYAGRPADIWALGVMLFVLLTGRYPFYDTNPALLFKRIKLCRFSCSLTEKISSEAKWLFYGMLRPNPTDRPTAEEILYSHWLQMDSKSLPDKTESVPPPKLQIAPQPQPQQRTVAQQNTTSTSSVQTAPITAAPPAFVRLVVRPQRARSSSQTQLRISPVQMVDAAVDSQKPSTSTPTQSSDQCVPDQGKSASEVTDVTTHHHHTVSPQTAAATASLNMSATMVLSVQTSGGPASRL